MYYVAMCTGTCCCFSSNGQEKASFAHAGVSATGTCCPLVAVTLVLQTQRILRNLLVSLHRGKQRLNVFQTITVGYGCSLNMLG